VAQYIELLIKNDLAESVEGEIVRYRITPCGEEVQGHLRELEKMMQEMTVVEEEIAAG
jgi:predicted transcriptional regulator